MSIKRFLKEWSDPCLKCERVGHNMKKQHRSGYYYDSGFRTVAKNVVQERQVCKRCGYTTEWETIESMALYSFSASIDISNEIMKHSENDPYWMDGMGDE